MMQPNTVVLLGIVDTAITTITQSWYLTAIVIAIILSVGLSLLSGLIDIAAYLTMLAVVVLVVFGIVNYFAPGLIPIITSPAFAPDVGSIGQFPQLVESAFTPLFPSVE